VGRSAAAAGWRRDDASCGDGLNLSKRRAAALGRGGARELPVDRWQRGCRM